MPVSKRRKNHYSRRNVATGDDYSKRARREPHWTSHERTKVACSCGTDFGSPSLLAIHLREVREKGHRAI